MIEIACGTYPNWKYAFFAPKVGGAMLVAPTPAPVLLGSCSHQSYYLC